MCPMLFKRKPLVYVIVRGTCQSTLTPAIIAPFGAPMRNLLLSVCLLTIASTLVAAQQYDLVLEGGRVMDPETGLDAVRNVGIRDGKIASISTSPLSGKRTIHAAGLVVAPGFIDLHQHGQELASQRVKAFDGVTTALEMEIGAPDVAQFLKSKQGQSHHSLRHHCQLCGGAIARLRRTPARRNYSCRRVDPPRTNPLRPNRSSAFSSACATNSTRELSASAWALSTPQALPVSRSSKYSEWRPSARCRSIPTCVALGESSLGRPFESTEEVIGAAAITGAALHIVHINSTCLRDSLVCLSLIDGARARGLDVTTEAYPYIAGMTAINSAVFNPGWREKLGIDYGNLVLPGTGEHLTKERFEELHNSNKEQWVLIFANTQEMVDKIIPNPLIMIASDGAAGHPRNAGTYARVLEQYVREKKTLTLMEALRKMTLMPAQMLERSTPAGHQKGRLQEGADADIVVFDPQTIADRSTFDKPMEPSVGVHYLLVGGTPVIDERKQVPEVFPGRALVGPGKPVK